MTKIDELGINADISQALPTGGPFGDYGEIDNVMDEGKTHFRHHAGEVLLLDVWATWCGPCQRPMQHNQEMLVKNEAAWAGKVRITAVSVDDAKETVVGRVNGKGWNKIQHLTLNGWNGEHRLIKDFNISGIPFVCLVDKFGKINFIGHPSSINLEERINQLIAQDKEGEQAAVAAPAQSEP
jgi:thiol-disulfide isomerase/thioredoxin